MRFYIIPAFEANQKSHLAYVREDCVFLVCLPNIPVVAKQLPCWIGGEFYAGQTQLEDWDEYGREVSCPTCLERARTGERMPSI